jgi:tetraacyldisaccharide 4'-kinase
LSSLERADAVVLTGEPPLDAALSAGNIWRTTRELSIDSPPKKPLAFCAIGRSKNFFDQLRDSGQNTADEVSFRDHHRYTELDIARLLRAAESSHADGFITTEKDQINLGPFARKLEPLAIARLETSLANADAALGTILATLKQRGKPVHERIPLA